ncbi:MAG: hypothetical protein RJQ00_01405 [Vicingaceae bacterium]
MKKLFFTIVFAFGFMLVGFASQNQTQQKQIAQKENEQSSSEKSKKYDFSLFKFITPDSEKQDTTKHKEDLLLKESKRDETTYIYENPRCFLMFS